jgi:drug/metabolite transporter (DMT)-like permease
MRPDRRQLWVLALLTLVWGLNWPVMKLGVSGMPGAPASYPPLIFRATSMWLGLPVLGAAMWWLNQPFRMPRALWGEVLRLALTNMVLWHVVVIVALQSLSSGRSAILGYTMPVFSALWGVAVFGERLAPRQLLGVLAAGAGVLLLLQNELARLAGAPGAASAVLLAACIWALGTDQLRRSSWPLPLLTLVFWMTALTAVVVTLLALIFESGAAHWPPPHTAWAIAYNAVGVFGFAHAAWFYLARHLPPVASTLSVMLIPVLGTFSGEWLLGEALGWQDFAAMLLMVAAIAAVLWRR